MAENQPTGTVVGSFTTTDPDASQTHTYTLVSGAGSTDNGLFSIGTGANADKLLTSAVFDYETRSSYSIRVRTTDNGTDPGPTSFEQTFTVTVNDLIELSGVQTDACTPAGGTATVGVAGSGTGYSYSWSPAPGGGQGTAAATGLNAGTTYTVTVSKAGMTSATRSFAITADLTPPTATTNRPAGLTAPPSGLLTNVPEAVDFGVVYRLNLLTNANYNSSAISYAINNAGQTLGTAPTRVAYYLELTNGSTTQWVWASMDNFVTSLGSNLPKLGLPHPTANNLFWDQTVNNLTVLSNVSSVSTGSGKSGRLEIWNGGYGQTAPAGVTGASSSAYDFGDTRNNDTGYGSFQVHSLTDRKTLLSYNGWNASSTDDVGIGNSSTSTSPDWTFTANAGTYTVKTLYILAGNASSSFTKAATLTLNAAGTATLQTSDVYVPGFVTDNCGSVNISLSKTNFTCADVGTTTVTVTAADAAGNSISKTAAVTIQAQAPTAPTALSLSSASVDEGQGSGTVVGSFTTTDGPTCPVQTHTYTLVSGAGSTDNALFSIGTGANAGKLLTNAVFDYETRSSYSVRVRVTDQGGLTFDQPFTISVNDVVELAVTGVSPARNARAAARTTSVDVTIAGDVDAATASNIRVFSQQYRGRRTATASTSGGTVTLTPTASSGAAEFKPGETVYVTVPGTVRGTLGQAVIPHVYQFTAATTGGSGVFGGGSDPAVGSSAYSVALGDVDADGDLDLLTANSGNNSVSVRLNNGAGSYSAPATNADPAVGSFPRSVALGDVDGDGDLDFVTANNGSNSVSVRLNNGSGSFSAPATNPNPAVGSGPISIALGDVDGDGDLDLVTANNSGSSVSVRVNNGAGSFSAPAANPNPTLSGNPTSVALGDVDADGDLDLLATYSFYDYDSGSSYGQVSVRLNNGAGSFSGGSDPSVAGNVQSVTLGDVDGDGDLDLLTASNDYSGTVSVRLNNGAGSFSGGSDPAVGTNPSSVALGDVDGDGDLDFVTVNSGYFATASVRLNNGAGSFSAPAANPNPTLSTYAYGLALGDVDSDGDLDFVTANNNYSSSTASVRLNLSAPTITSFTPTTGSAGTVVTITGTNFANVTAVQFNGVAASTYTVNSTTQITVTVPAAATTGPISVVAAAGSASSTGSFTVLPRLTVTGVSPARNARAAARTTPVTVSFSGDVDAATAGNIRVFSPQYRGRRTATASTSGNTVTLTPTVPATGSQAAGFKPGETVMVTVPASVRSTIGQATLPQVYQFTAATTGGSGNFGGGSDPAVAGSAQSVAVGDVDGDGDLDLVTVNTNNSVSVRLNNGSGSFSAPATNPNPALGGTPGSVTLGDVDGDGDLDLLATYFIYGFDFGDRYGMLSVRLNNGAGSFSGGSDLSLSGIPSSVALGDVDGDGDLDLLAGCNNQSPFGGSGNGLVNVRLNNGAGSFSGGSDPTVGSSPRGVALGDVDGDGDLDLLTANNFTNSVSVRLNNGAGNFTAPATNADPAVGSGPRSVTLGDVDGDGDLDLLTANGGSNSVSVRLNDGAGNFTAPAANANPAVGTTPISVAFGDLDDDGDLDFVAANSGSSTVSVRLNLPAPTITSFTPTSGSAGTVVTITGTNFTGATALSFNGTAAASFTVNSATQITATVPAGATSGPISVTTPLGVGTSSQSFYLNLTISTAGQTVLAGAYNNVTITGTGVATLGGAVQVVGTFEVQGGGQLNTGCQPLTGAGSFMLNAGATLFVCDPAGLSPTGSTGAVQVTGTRSFSADALYVYSGTAAQVTGPGLPGTVRSFTLDNAQGATLTGNLTIATALTTTTGTLRTDSYKATLSSTATLTESATSYVTGTVETTRDVSTAGAAERFGNLGLTLTPDNSSSVLPGPTRVRRVTGTTLAGQGTSRSIRRYYDIEPTVNSGLNTTLVFGYLDAELDGASEAGLGLFRSATGLAGPWQPVAHATQSAADNTVTATGVDHFSIWTLSSTANPLPVVLVDFTAGQEGSRARLRWTTAQEKNNDRFEVEVSPDGQRFTRIGTVAGQGTSTSRHDYQLTDEQLLQYGAPVVYYRLKQMDYDGTASYSSIRAVQVSGAALAPSLVLFPTAPAAGQSVHYRYQGAALPGNAQLEVYDALGRCVGRQPAAATGALTMQLPAGWYIVRLRTAAGTVQDRFYQP